MNIYISKLLTLAFIAALTNVAVAEGEEKVTYEQHAKPIFMQRCSACHNSQRKEGDLDVTNFTNLMIGGGSGEVIEAGAADDSYLYRLVTHEEGPEMPPGDNTIPAPEIETLKKWINGGALENSGSVAKKRKPKADYSAVDVGNTRPEVNPIPSRLPLVPEIVTDRASTVHSIAANPWAPFVAVSSPRQVLLYRTDNLKFSGVIPFPEGQPESMRFSRNGQLLIIGGGKAAMAGKVVIWDAMNGRRVTTVGDWTDSVLAADINPSQTLVAHGGPAKVVQVCDMDGEVVYELNKHTEWITALQFSPEGNFLLTGDRNGGLHAWEAETGNEVLTLNGHSQAISSIDWRVDGKLVLTGSLDGSVRIWDGKTGKQIKNWVACGSGVTDALFTRDGNVVTSGRDHLVRIWDQNGKQILQTEKMPDQVISAAYCSETNRLIAGDWSGNVRVWESSNPKHVGSLVANPPALETKIANAEKQLEASQAMLAPLVQQSADRQAQIAALKAATAADVVTQAELDGSIKTLDQQIAGANEQLESTVGQHEAWQAELESKNTAMPLLAIALQNSRSALQSLPSDAELIVTVERLESKHAAIGKRVDELQNQIQKTNQKQEVTQAEIVRLGGERELAVANLTAINSKVSAAEMELGRLNDEHQKLKPELAAAEADVQKFGNAVSYWKSEIEFANNLAQLESTLEAAYVADQEQLELLAAQQQKLAAAEALVQQAQQRRAESEQQIGSIEQQIQQLKSK